MSNGASDLLADGMIVAMIHANLVVWKTESG